MDCHIIPITYLKQWATKDTLDLDRHKLKTYVFQKDKIGSKQESELIEKIQSIKIKDFYILDIYNSDHLTILESELIESYYNKESDLNLNISSTLELKNALIEKTFPELNAWAEKYFSTLEEQKDRSVVKRIEEFLSKIEKRWANFVKETDQFTSRGTLVEAKYKSELIEFVSIQVYRTPDFINPKINSIHGCIENIIPEVSKNSKFEPNSTLLRMLYDYRNYKTNRRKFMKRRPGNIITPIAKTVQDLNTYQCTFIVASHNTLFITSDNPCFIVKSSELYSGVYLPISPRVCLLLVKSKPVLSNKYIIMDANKRIVNFINHLTIKNSIKEVFSCSNDIESFIQSDFLLEDFKNMFNNSNMIFGIR